MNKWIIGTAAAAILAIPALAQMQGHEGHGMMNKGPSTRAEVEAEVKARFAELDTNKDGSITREESDAFRNSRMTEMRNQMFTAIDTDKNGQISRAEFDAHHANMDKMAGHGGPGHDGKRGMGKGMAKMDLFTTADTNNDGKVTLAEANGRALSMFDKADADKNGTVTPEERKAAWKTMIKDHVAKAQKAQ